jgi:hypothetical protein
MGQSRFKIPWGNFSFKTTHFINIKTDDDPGHGISCHLG